VTSPPQRLSVPRRVTTPPKELSQAQRATLHRVADQLVPAADGNPSATQAPGFDGWLDRCIAARRDAIDLLLSTLDQLAGADDLDRALRGLHADDAEGRFHLISSIVAGAYLAGDHIRRLIGYPGQFRQPARVDEAAEELADGILDPVLERGHIYISGAGE
jgi:hypothetical protein